MGGITIQALGLAAVRISDGELVVYVDAPINFGKHPLPGPGGEALGAGSFDDADIIIVTHDHDDHYHPGMVGEAARRSGATVVGPPSIARAMLVDQGLDPGKLRILYHQDPGRPDSTEIGGARVSSFASRHFHDGDNLTIHNSYLVEMGGKRIYLCGDSYEVTRKDARLAGLDAMVPNLVFFDRAKERASILGDFARDFAPRAILPVHLLECDWTIPLEDVRDEAERLGLGEVAVLDRENPLYEI